MFSFKLKRMIITCSNYSKVYCARGLSISANRIQTRSKNFISASTRFASARTVVSLKRQIHLASVLLSEYKDNLETEQSVTEEFVESTNESEPEVEQQQERYVAYLSGIPWSADFEEVKEFLSGCNLKNGEASFFPLAISDGRFSGNAYVEFESQEDLQRALEKDMAYMRHRFIRVETTHAENMEKRIAKLKQATLASRDVGNTTVVHMRGLPFSCTKEDISSFFEGIEIAEDGIALEVSDNGRCQGTAYVEFKSRTDFMKSLERDKHFIQNRYIEIFASNKYHIDKIKQQLASQQANLKASRKIQMMGLPWSAQNQDISDFFLPLKPEKIDILEDKYGRSSGRAYVWFASPEDADEAMKKHQNYISERFINLKRVSSGRFVEPEDNL